MEGARWRAARALVKRVRASARVDERGDASGDEKEGEEKGGRERGWRREPRRKKANSWNHTLGERGGGGGKKRKREARD